MNQRDNAPFTLENYQVDLNIITGHLVCILELCSPEEPVKDLPSIIEAAEQALAAHLKLSIAVKAKLNELTDKLVTALCKKADAA